MCLRNWDQLSKHNMSRPWVHLFKSCCGKWRLFDFNLLIEFLLCFLKGFPMSWTKSEIDWKNNRDVKHEMACKLCHFSFSQPSQFQGWHLDKKPFPQTFNIVHFIQLWWTCLLREVLSYRSTSCLIVPPCTLCWP